MYILKHVHLGMIHKLFIEQILNKHCDMWAVKASGDTSQQIWLNFQTC